MQDIDLIDGGVAGYFKKNAGGGLGGRAQRLHPI